MKWLDRNLVPLAIVFLPMGLRWWQPALAARSYTDLSLFVAFALIAYLWWRVEKGDTDAV